MFLTLAWLSWKHTGKMLRFGTLSGAMKAPMWIFYLPMPFFSLVIALRFLLLGWRQIRPVPAAAGKDQGA
jgi:C4-dicarboxylate transporter DctQ subunit